MNLRLQIDGASLLHAFARAPEATRRHLRIGLKESMEEVKEQAQKHHGFTSRTKDLENSVKADFESDLVGVVYLDPAKAPYAAAIHNGSKRHEIKPKDGGKALRWPSKFGGFMFAFGPMEKSQRGSVLRWVAKNAPGSRVMFRWPVHPGTKPDPFLFDALRTKADRVQFILTESVRDAFREAGLA